MCVSVCVRIGLNDIYYQLKMFHGEIKIKTSNHLYLKFVIVFILVFFIVRYQQHKYNCLTHDDNKDCL